MITCLLGEMEFRAVLEATLAKLHGMLEEVRGLNGRDKSALAAISRVDTWQKGVMVRALAVAMPASGSRASGPETEMPEIDEGAFEGAARLAVAIRAVEGIRELYGNFRLLEHSPSV
ncbi:MAG: hypothetical protein U0136_06360 [Bdellovibrionota bacterium]